MLTPTPNRDGQYVATCDRCRVNLAVELDGGPEGARATLVGLGWAEASIHGRPRERWLWWCPRCSPTPAMSWGRVTPR